MDPASARAMRRGSLRSLAAMIGSVAPWAVAGVALAFPLYVASNPHRFGPPRLQAVADDATGFAGTGMFASLPPLVDRSAERAADAPASLAPGDGAMARRRSPPAPFLDSKPVGAIARRSFRVRAVAGGSVLVVDAAGARAVAPGERLPSGEWLVRARPDGLLVTRGPLDRGRPSPAQGPRVIVPGDHGRDGG